MMKKIFISSALLATVAAFAQTGKVGINTSTPQATLDIKPSAANADAAANSVEGLLVPRVSRLRAANMGFSVPESTLVYINSTADGAASGTTVNVDANGYYYFSGGLWVKVGSGAGAQDTTIYSTDGTLSGNRTVNMDGKSLTYSNIAGGIGINKVASDAYGLDLNTQTRTYGDVTFQAVGSSIDAGDIVFRNGASAPTPNKIAARLWSNPLGSGLFLAGHDYAQAPFTADTNLSDPDLQILPTGELKLNTVKENAAAGNVLVYGTDGVVGYKTVNTLYTADGILTANRTVNMANNSLTFTNPNKFTIGATPFNGGLFNVRGSVRALKGYPAAIDISDVGFAFEDDGDTGMFAEGGTSFNSSSLVFRNDGRKIMTLHLLSNGTEVIVDGTTRMNGEVYKKITVVTINYTLQPGDYFLIVDGSSDVTITLPAGYAGREVVIFQRGTGVVSITNTLGGIPQLGPNNSLIFISDGTNWLNVINKV